jgi:hypothetical protein
MKVGRNDPCPCGSGLKVKRCCGTEAVRRRQEAAADLFSLAFHFPRYRPATAGFDEWARSASVSLDRDTLGEGVAHLDRRERHRIAAGFEQEYPDEWASVVADLGDEALAEDLVLGGAVVAGLTERTRGLDSEALELLEAEGAARADPVQALALMLDADDLWSVIESEQAAEALESADYGRTESLLAAEAERLSTRWHRERLDVLVGRLRDRLPDTAYPLASAALERACDRVEADDKLARRLAAELLLDSLPRVLAAAA